MKETKIKNRLFSVTMAAYLVLALIFIVNLLVGVFKNSLPISAPDTPTLSLDRLSVVDKGLKEREETVFGKVEIDFSGIEYGNLEPFVR